MAMSGDRQDREYEKFVETTAGDTASRGLTYGYVTGGDILPIKVVSDGGTPALGKLACTVG